MQYHIFPSLHSSNTVFGFNSYPYYFILPLYWVLFQILNNNPLMPKLIWEMNHDNIQSGLGLFSLALSHSFVPPELHSIFYSLFEQQMPLCICIIQNVNITASFCVIPRLMNLFWNLSSQSLMKRVNNLVPNWSFNSYSFKQHTLVCEWSNCHDFQK